MRNFDGALGRPLTVDEIAARDRDPRTLRERAADEQRANDISVLQGTAMALDRAKRFHGHNPLALKVKQRDFDRACEPFGGEAAARALGLLS